MKPTLMALLFALSACLGVSLHAQPEWKLRASLLNEEALHSAAIGEHQKALALFHQVFDLDEPSRTHCYDAVSSALAIGDAASANQLLSMGVQHGFDPMAFSSAADLQAHLRSQESLPFRSGWQRDQEAFASRCDSALIKAIEAMREADQAARRGKGYTEETQHVDSLNFEHLIALVEMHGFPTEREIGLSVGSVHLLLWHHRAPEYPRSAQWRRMLPLVQAAIAKGEVSPSYLCMFEDMAAFEEDRPQPYGTLLFYFNQQPDLIHLADRETLNSDRASVGLGPIEWSAQEAGIDLSTVRFAEP